MFSNSHFQFQTQVKRAADGAGREVVLANPGLVEARWQDTHTHHYADDADYADLYIMVKCVCVCHEKVTKFV